MILKDTHKKIRYAVIGLGHIAQTAVLPAFKRIKKNSQLVALVSGSKEKLKLYGDKYHIEKRYLYSEFDDCLKRSEIDALYISTPHFFHRTLMERAASFGVHVICEKPLAISIEDCVSMIHLAKKNNIHLMTAYRLYLDPANQEILKLSHSKRIGDLKIFNSTYVIQVKDPQNIRLEEIEKGGGPLHDIGVYCINTARNLFNSEPLQVFAMATTSKESRFKHINEVVSCILKFPEGRIANFTVSFGAFPTSDYEIIGTKGRLRLEKGYRYNQTMTLKTYLDHKIISKKYPKHDQFAAELSHFSECIIKNKKPISSGEEGLIDIKIIEALILSIDLGSPIEMEEMNKKMRPPEAFKISLPSFGRSKH
jgi:predicted dehydrogenase